MFWILFIIVCIMLWNANPALLIGAVLFGIISAFIYTNTKKNKTDKKKGS